MDNQINKNNHEYQDSLVAFIDILGFKELIKKSLVDGETFKLITSTIDFLKALEEPSEWRRSKSLDSSIDCELNTNPDYKIKDKMTTTCFSDSIVISIKVNNNSTSILNVVSALTAHLSRIGTILFTHGILIRGGITSGKLIHSQNGKIYGQALIDAYSLESEFANNPRIILSKKLINKLDFSTHSQQLYKKILVRFSDGFVGFHQFKYVEHFNSNNNIPQTQVDMLLDKIRKKIIKGLDEHFELPSVFYKYKWLMLQYNSLSIQPERLKKIHELDGDIREAFKSIYYSHVDDVHY